MGLGNLRMAARVPAAQTDGGEELLKYRATQRRTGFGNLRMAARVELAAQAGGGEELLKYRARQHQVGMGKFLSGAGDVDLGG